MALPMRNMHIADGVAVAAHHEQHTKMCLVVGNSHMLNLLCMC